MFRTGVAWMVGAVCMLWAGTAQAATYDVYACRLPDGSAAPAGGWSTTGLMNGADARATVGCPGGSLTAAVVRSATTHVRPTTIGWRFDAVDDTTIAAYDVTRRVAVTVGAGSAFNYEAFLDAIDYAHTREIDHCWSSEGCPGLSASQPLARSGLAAHSLILFTDCSSGPPNDCAPDMTAEIDVDRARMTLNDTIAPVFSSAPVGSLLTRALPSRASGASRSAPRTAAVGSTGRRSRSTARS